ncbi:hypothetical protein OROHE_011767 [Orobanche hederae]
MPSQEILKIRDEILKIRDGTPLEAEGILIFRKRRKEFWHTEKSPRNCSVWHFSSKLDVPKILKIRDGTPLE